MPTVDELATLARDEFAFLLEGEGYLQKMEIIWPESFKGGFVLTYGLGKRHTRTKVQYLDMELEITHEGKQLFGHADHPGFKGNMFSREHLAGALPRVADWLRNDIQPTA